MLSQPELDLLSADFETKPPVEIIQWAVETFAPDIAVSTSFQTQSMPLLHMVTQVMPDIRILFLDTGYHFWETLTFRERIQHEWQLNVVDLYRDSRWDIFVRDHIRTLPLEDANLCCYLHKVQPMQRALSGLRAWITGIRRDQTPERAQAQILELESGDLVKVNALLNWSKLAIEPNMDCRRIRSTNKVTEAWDVLLALWRWHGATTTAQDVGRVAARPNAGFTQIFSGTRIRRK
jgi:phosphoadenylyl-sulfate reductase (thioredoxin)